MLKPAEKGKHKKPPFRKASQAPDFDPNPTRTPGPGFSAGALGRKTVSWANERRNKKLAQDSQNPSKKDLRLRTLLGASPLVSCQNHGGSVCSLSGVCASGLDRWTAFGTAIRHVSEKPCHGKTQLVQESNLVNKRTHQLNSLPWANAHT